MSLSSALRRLHSVTAPVPPIAFPTMAPAGAETISKTEVYHMEQAASSPSDVESTIKAPTFGAAGNVQLILNNETVLIPTPSPDPKGVNNDAKAPRENRR